MSSNSPPFPVIARGVLRRAGRAARPNGDDDGRRPDRGLSADLEASFFSYAELLELGSAHMRPSSLRSFTPSPRPVREQ